MAGATPTTRPYGVIHVGTPAVADLKLLDAMVAMRDSWDDKQKRVNGMTVWVEDTRGLLVGAMEDLLLGHTRQEFEDKKALVTEKQRRSVTTMWGRNGRTMMRQAAPLPATIRAVTLHVDIQGGR